MCIVKLKIACWRFLSEIELFFLKIPWQLSENDRTLPHCCLQRRPTIPAYSSKWSRTRHFAISWRNELKLSLNAHLTSLPILASFGFGSMNTIGPPGGQGGPDWPPMHIFTTFQLNELKLSVNTHIASLPILASIWFGYINTNMAPQGPRLAPRGPRLAPHA